jgi:hypothetical protein
MRVRHPLCLLLLVAACGSRNADGSGDVDGDGISDADEGRADGVDTDHDGIPDYRDLDSDGDGILDSVEAGDHDLSTPAMDTDGDGVPDFRDTDADGDGILDSDELDPHFQVVDTDLDGVPDFLDLDSDGDTISDHDEGTIAGLGGSSAGLPDTDKDGIPDFRDLDSDNDGVPDACEAGDGDLHTSPRDSDSDQISDFRDLDSDNDGIGDGEEDANRNCSVDPGESSPLKADTDGDGVPDLVEKVAGTDPNNAGSVIPKTDFYFVLPFQHDRGTGDLDFATDVKQADVFFSIDNTGSMEGETANIQANLVSSIIPGISAVIPNAAYGLGRFRDFPIDPHGLTGDRPYDLRQPITTTTGTIGAAITALPIPFGGLDIPEAGYEALYQWGTGAGIPTFGMPAFQSNAPNGIGGAGFRKDSLPVVVHVTDATAHVPADYSEFTTAAHGRDQVVDAYKAIGARIVGINSLENAGTDYSPRAQLEDLAIATKAHIPPDETGQCPTGVAGAAYPAVQVAGVPRCPVVFDVQTDGTGLSNLIVDAIQQLAALGELDVSTRPMGKVAGEQGEVIPPGTTTASFLKSIHPVLPPPAGATIDGDVFRGVKPGSKVTFRLDAYNDFVPETTKDQLFTIDIQVLGDGVTLLDTRRVFIVVPKKLEGSVVR